MHTPISSLKLSQTSKLGARSWSLQARETCPGSIGADGQPVEACAACYATQGTYHFAAVKAARANNREDWQRPDWVSEMVQELENDRFFRWFDSGDCYALELAEKILSVMRLTPWVSHWMPTRMHKFPKFLQVLKQMQALENTAIRFSSDSITGEFLDYLHGSVIIHPTAETPAGATRCNSPKQGGKCLTCRACWDTVKHPVIAYEGHGKKIIKLYREKGVQV